MSQELYRIDGVLWVVDHNTRYGVLALCPADKIIFPISDFSGKLVCDECKREYNLPRRYIDETEFVLSKIKSKELSSYKIIDFDGEATPLAENSDSDGKYFVIAKLMETKVGKRMVVYAGEKGVSPKSQIFIEPDIKRLAFDQKDQHPSELFVSLEAQFKDGTSHSINTKNKDE